MSGVKHIWTKICKKSIRDKDTNTVTLVNLLESFAVTVPESKKVKLGKPGPRCLQFSASYKVVTLYKRSVSGKMMAFSHMITFHDPNGELLAQKMSKITLEKDVEDFTQSDEMEQLYVTVPGEYAIKTWVKEGGEADYSLCGSTSFQIKFNTAKSSKVVSQKITKTQTRRV